jgi:hypothetical protein
MSRYAKNKEEAILYYKKCIKKQFDVSDQKADQLANRLYDQEESHGVNPNSLHGLEETVKIIVGSWIKNNL